MEFPTLEAVLVWIATGGGAMALAGYVVSYLLENWPAWHNFPRFVKTVVPIIIAGTRCSDCGSACSRKPSTYAYKLAGKPESIHGY